MMKRLIIVCEGLTEQQFCAEILSPYFIAKDISVSYPTIKKTNGGVCTWTALRKQIMCHLHENAYVTTFVDFYGIKDSMNFPSWMQSKTINNKNQRIEFLEQAMKNDLDSDLQPFFLPYLQLHEFEALLFCNVNAFDTLIPNEDFIGRETLLKILDDYPNPELINDSTETSPSHRMNNIVKGYEKPLYGVLIAQAIGLKAICDKCPHFNEWIERMEGIVK